MENSLKGLMLAAGIIITCIIISLGFYIAREARDTASEGTGQINQLQAEFTDASKTMYDGTEVSGSEVLNVIRKFSDETMGILGSISSCRWRRMSSSRRSFCASAISTASSIRRLTPPSTPAAARPRARVLWRSSTPR